MAQTGADPSMPRCSSLLSRVGIQKSQPVGPDPVLPRARDARGRFLKGCSGNPRGRPRGIRNPRRRVPDLVARPLGAQALSDVLDRKPRLLRPLAMQLPPPRLAARDPVERLGIDPSALRTTEDFRQVLATVLAAAAGGKITPAEAARIARRVRRQWRALRRLARAQRRLARKACLLRSRLRSLPVPHPPGCDPKCGQIVPTVAGSGPMPGVERSVRGALLSPLGPALPAASARA
jgi:hypothetical protein